MSTLDLLLLLVRRTHQRSGRTWTAAYNLQIGATNFKSQSITSCRITGKLAALYRLISMLTIQNGIPLARHTPSGQWDTRWCQWCHRVPYPSWCLESVQLSRYELWHYLVSPTRTEPYNSSSNKIQVSLALFRSVRQRSSGYDPD